VPFVAQDDEIGPYLIDEPDQRVGGVAYANLVLQLDSVVSGTRAAREAPSAK
jgi:hypothetical protein